MTHFAVPVRRHDDEIHPKLLGQRRDPLRRLTAGHVSICRHPALRKPLHPLAEIGPRLLLAIGGLVPRVTVNDVHQAESSAAETRERPGVVDHCAVAAIPLERNQDVLVHQNEPPARL
ncbi:MAG: hypothetical protein A2133_09265 [Actinobacteria bacterium RBG_16_64_13]|nr:MAG: hypothetical protein A2133_09265 [Actinobacteria bacterium RBG_16_64_13]